MYTWRTINEKKHQGYPAVFAVVVLVLVSAFVFGGVPGALAATTASSKEKGGKTLTSPTQPWRNRRSRQVPTSRSLARNPKSAESTSQVRVKKGMALLNFSDAGIKEVVMAISRITGKNFILAPEVLGRKITIRTTKPIKKKDVFGIFETMLAVNGLSAVKSGAYYTIVPTRAARQRGLALYNTRDRHKIAPGDRMINLLVPIKFISANDVAQILKPSLSPGGNIAVYPKANTLIITERASQARRFLLIINKLDVDLFERLNVSLVHVENVGVKTMARELLDIFKVLGYGKETSQFYTIPIERFNSLIVFASSEELLASAKKWIGQLDQASSTNEVSTHIYYVKNDKASNIKDMLDKLYGREDETDKHTSSTASDTASTQSDAKAKGRDAKGGQTTSGTTAHSSSSTHTSARHHGDGNGLDIFIYEPSNAIIIRSSQRDYQMVLRTIRELDRPPQQVLIDAVVVEVALDESTKYGIQWSALTGNVNLQNNTGLFSTTLDNPNSVISTPIGLAATSGLNVLATDTKTFFGFLQAFASKGKVNVLSNPHILVQNYAKASISVGSDEPIATQSTQTAVTTTASLIQSIEYRRTGIILTVTPHITEGGMVALTLHQEISDVSTSRTVGDGTFPSFTNREAETSVVIKDGQTIAIGGLIDTKKNKTHSGIPILSKIPLLGNLFKFTSITNDRTELVILLTPRVISSSDDALSATDDLEKKLSTLTEMIRKNKAGRPEKGQK